MSSIANLVCVVTGSSGFVGRRLVEMLLERGAKQVVAMDVREPALFKDPSLNFISADLEKKIRYCHGKDGDVSDMDAVLRAFSGADAVFHIAAAVGPFPRPELFHRVNVVGTQNVVEACKALKIRKLVAASTPSIFFDGHNISGKKPADLPIVKPGHFLAAYAETKAVAEKLVREANNPPHLLTVNIAPHQVYGERDGLFLPNFLDAKDKLRIFGNGQNLASFCYVDNYCHGLILGHDAMHDKSPILGKFYLITDGPPQNFWHALDRAVVKTGGTSLQDKLKLPRPLLYAVAYVMTFLGKVFNFNSRISPFNVTMLTIDRYFDISDSVKDLNYKPLKNFDEAWDGTLAWFNKHEAYWRQCAKASLAGANAGPAQAAKKA